MPVEIRELEINGSVSDSSQESQVVQNRGGLSYQEKEAIIAECLARVRKMLEKQAKR